MKKAKITRVKDKVNKNEEDNKIVEEYSLKKLLIIILVLVIVFGVFYYITTLVVKPNSDIADNNHTVTEIDSSSITLSSLLDRKEKEYYVLTTKQSLYDSHMNYIDIYNKYIKDYNAKENSLKVYKVNLDDALNRNYISDKTNITDSIQDLKLNNEVLFKINNGKIEKYYVGNEDIIKALSQL